MTHHKIIEEYASYSEKIKELRQVGETLSEKAKALEELHYSLLYLKDVREQYPNVGTIVQSASNGLGMAVKQPQEIKNEERLLNIEPEYNLKGDKNDRISYSELKELSHPIKEELVKLLDLGSKTSASLSEVLIYLYSHNASDKETLTKQLSMGRSSLYRFASLLKAKDLIETVGNRGETQFAINQNGINLIRRVLEGLKIYS